MGWVRVKGNSIPAPISIARRATTGDSDMAADHTDMKTATETYGGFLNILKIGSIVTAFFVALVIFLIS